MGKPEVTIYHIASELKLSASTVSRALSGNKMINEKTRKRVTDCAERLGYRVNIFATNLRKGGTKTIGVIVPRLDSQFVASFLAGAEKTASQKGYTLLIAQSFEDVDKEIANCKTMLDKRVDGLMVAVAKNSSDVKHFKPFLNYGIPLVFFDRINSNIEAPAFVIDNFSAAYRVVQHLAEQKCQSVAHVTINSSNSTYTERVRGFSQACQLLGIESRIIYIDSLDFEHGSELARQMIDHNNLPDGMFFANDITAAGFISSLNEFNIVVPEKVAIVGFNNDISGLIVKPNLTTINYPAPELGTMATNHLIEHILGNNNLNVANQIVLKSDLVVRGSSFRLKNLP